MASGGPSWRQLLDQLRARLTSVDTFRSDDTRLRKAIERGDYPYALSRIEDMVGRSSLEERVAEILAPLKPSSLVRSITDWPFAGIITTNYDTLIERALTQLGCHDWVAVGNTSEEIAKISGANDKVVWHIHGSIENSEISHLVLTEADYGELYSDGSSVFNTLRGLLQHRRIVMMGFGFADQELMHLLRSVGRMCSPERPAFAFVTGIQDRGTTDLQAEFLERYNVDIVPYDIVDGNHNQLTELVQIYSSLLLRRTLKLRRARTEAPSFDPETTALLTYNSFVLKHGIVVDGEMRSRMLKARIVSRLRYEGPLTKIEVLRELAERARQLSSASSNSDEGERAVEEAISGLVSDRLVDEHDGGLILSELGRQTTEKQAGSAELLRQRFQQALNARALRKLSNVASGKRVADVLFRYLQDCMRRRGLGVALAWITSAPYSRKFHMTGLLQCLPEYLEQLTTIEEAHCAVRIIEEFLADPTQSEASYLGTMLQAEFTVQLLAFSPELMTARLEELARTAFLIDSNILIARLARSSRGNAAANTLISQLSQFGCAIATTEALVQEVRNHAGWALELAERQSGILNSTMLEAATGRAGFRENLFIAGFIAEAADAGGTTEFPDYLESVTGRREGRKGHLRAFSAALEDIGIPVQTISQWGTEDEDLFVYRDEIADEIEVLRRTNGSFRGSLQVNAEAEVRLIVERLRSGDFAFETLELRQAFFISNSRVVDNVGRPGTRVTMRPESVLQWLSTVGGAGPEELGCLVDGMLWELGERGLTLVDREMLARMFAPLIESSRAELQSQLANYGELSAQEYGMDVQLAFQSLDSPIIAHAYLVQRVEDAEAERDYERAARAAAESEAKLTERERRELEKLRARQAERKRRYLSRVRKEQSRPRPRRRGKS